MIALTLLWRTLLISHVSIFAYEPINTRVSIYLKVNNSLFKISITMGHLISKERDLSFKLKPVYYQYRFEFVSFVRLEPAYPANQSRVCLKCYLLHPPGGYVFIRI